MAMQFPVPQFVEVEDKIIGPLTLRQFLILLFGAGVEFIVYGISPSLGVFIFLSIFIIPPIVFIALGKYNGQPGYKFILKLLKYLRSVKLRVFKREMLQYKAPPPVKASQKKDISNKPTKPSTPVTTSRMERLAYILDTGGEYQEPQAEEEYKGAVGP